MADRDYMTGRGQRKTPPWHTRHPRLQRNGPDGAAMEWRYPDDPANQEEDRWMAALYDEQRQKRNQAYAEQRQEYLAQVERERQAMMYRRCLHCGNDVAKDRPSLYCTRKCRNEAMRQRIDMRKAGALDDATCPVCGGEVEHHPDATHPRVFCTSACRKRGHKRRTMGAPISDAEFAEYQKSRSEPVHVAPVFTGPCYLRVARPTGESGEDEYHERYFGDARKAADAAEELIDVGDPLSMTITIWRHTDGIEHNYDPLEQRWTTERVGHE